MRPSIIFVKRVFFACASRNHVTGMYHDVWRGRQVADGRDCNGKIVGAQFCIHFSSFDVKSASVGDLGNNKVG